MSRVLIMAGGTGGHVFPALALARRLMIDDVQVSWLGTRKGIESRVVPEAKIDIDYIRIEGVRGRGALGLLKAPFLIVAALWQAIRVLRSKRPDVVIGFGGFASGPGGLAAWLLRIPVVIHEQNAVAGTTNKILARFARVIVSGFADVLPGCRWVGNPVRDEIVNLAPPVERFASRQDQPLHLLVLGGSLGARAINELVPAALASCKPSQVFNVWHQCGNRHEEPTVANYLAYQVNARVEPFITDMASAYKWADIVICRAGALTVAELAAAGLGALFIPLPSAIDDHQTHNAAVMVGAGAAISIPEAELNAESLARLLTERLSERSTLTKMAVAARSLHKDDAAGAVAQVTRELINE
ncbi:undecaprenyldiphospho-muramoylpentapeptide beta-N-acetylglucosaminyltransferase [Gilvimarinus polysaccharolyticus]|uniref:undecaprenyldiphospho-muramoylpentapeptide beta-N-acetylglucosaminyltransferase n=1 Tax=Gilvimarinus polysaccharolyticus TaxID=863921 RepID=UPI0006736DC1|nr:undecaprenyldiphospho-muramoylpentapeptide beta-N-acetylglucosaminyltransferase [Gilvimarinus polysaccharolyticus]